MALAWWFAAILWLVACSSFAAWVAHTKRRSALGWFALGILFGPVTLAASLGISPAGRPCRACRETIDPRASVCPRCRTDAPIAAVSQAERTRQRWDRGQLLLFIAVCIGSLLVIWALAASP